jgi:hypothetical protein
MKSKTPRQQAREKQRVVDFINALIADFMYYVKKGNDTEESRIEIDLKYKYYNAKWKHKCHDKSLKWMQLKEDAFEINVKRLVTEAPTEKQVDESRKQNIEKPTEKVIRFTSKKEMEEYFKGLPIKPEYLGEKKISKIIPIR